MREPAPLVARGLGFRYETKVVVESFDLEIAPGEVVGLRGPSGTGKTTIGRMLAGHLRPHAGSVTIGGEPTPASGLHPVQLVAQHPELAMNPRWKLSRILAEAGAIDEGLMTRLSISGEWMGRFPNELSGGELQRIAVARALAPRTPFIVADEISAMLDSITQAQLWAVILEEVATRGLGVLAIAHDDALLDRIAHRVIDLVEVPAVS